MKYEPHDYQRFAADYIISHPISAILLGCGLGKTSIALTAIDEMLHDRFLIRKALVVAPIRVCQNSWPDELRKWDHLRDIRWALAVGTQAERLAALRENAELTIINRENLAWLIEDSGVPFDFDLVVLDELSSFKNWQSKRYRAFMKVRPKIKRVVGMTGTPSSNGLIDLFAEYRCLDMGERLGRFIGRYRDEFFAPDRRNGNIVYSYRVLPGAEDEIYRRIGDITISMKTTDYLDMPELVTSEYSVTLDEEERKQYDAMKQDLLLQLPEGEVTAANAAALSGKLSQLSGGAVYADDGSVTVIHSKKLDALEDIIEAAQSAHSLRPAGPAGGHPEMERRRNPGGADPSGLGGSWPEPAAGRQHHRLVFPALVPRALHPDRRPAFSPGAAGGDRVGDPHHGEGHHRRANRQGAEG